MRFKFWITVAFVLASASAFGSTTPSLPFLNDNFPAALREAKQRNLPVFVECWAPW